MTSALPAGRGRSLARLLGYTLLSLYVLGLLASLLPLPINDPSAALGLLGQAIDGGGLVAVAVVAFHAGLGGDSRPAPWEQRLGALAPALLVAAGIVYLALGLSVVPVGLRIRSQGMAQLQGQLGGGRTLLQELRRSVQAAPDPQSLGTLLRNQPQLAQGLTGDLARDRPLLLARIDRDGAALAEAARRRGAETNARLLRQMLRLLLSGVVLAGFHLLAALIWRAPARRS
jgi:hypothetical protein